MTIFREQCSLILDRNTIVPTSDGFVGTFIPVNPDTIKWLTCLEGFFFTSERTLMAHGYDTVPIEVGPVSYDFKNLSAEQRLKRLYETPMDKIGLVFSNVDPVFENVNKTLIGYSFTIKFRGLLKEYALALFSSDQPFILSAKALSDDLSINGNVYKYVTNILGLELLKLNELEMGISETILEKCKSITDQVSNNQFNKKSIDVSKFITDEISLGNVDLESVIKLNIAAGNGIDFNSDVSPEVVESNLKRQIGIDINECFELLEGYIAGDVSLMRDALADKRITLNGFQPILPFSLIEDYRSAVNNNFTRFDSTLERALETQEKYADLNVKTEITQVSLKGKEQTEVYYVNKVMEECTDINGETYSKGKWVKSKYFNNDKFKDYVGLLADTDVHNKAENITRRYQEIRALIQKLMNHLDDSYMQAKANLTD